MDHKPKKFLLPYSTVSINPLTGNGILRFCATALQLCDDNHKWQFVSLSPAHLEEELFAFWQCWHGFNAAVSCSFSASSVLWAASNWSDSARRESAVGTKGAGMTAQGEGSSETTRPFWLRLLDHSSRTWSCSSVTGAQTPI